MDFVLRNCKKFKFFQINKLIYNYRFNKNSSTLNTNNKLQPYLDFLVLPVCLIIIWYIKNRKK